MLRTQMRPPSCKMPRANYISQIYGMVMLMFFIMVPSILVHADLSSSFYEQTCPQVDSIVKTLMAFFSNDTNAGGNAQTPPALLRLHFHDCLVQGCDASVLLRKTKIGDEKVERDAPPNQSLALFRIIDRIKDRLEIDCPGIVSCADILALAAKHAVLLSGGPDIPIRLGRLDGISSSFEMASTNLPLHNFTVDQQIDAFERVGLNSTDLAILTGSHTLGVGRCFAIRPTLDMTPALDPPYRDNLSQKCPPGSDSGSIETQPLTAMDPITPVMFDNNYYVTLLADRGLFFSDRSLRADPRTSFLVQTYATDQAKFFVDFSDSLVKMSELSVKTDPAEGEIRQKCAFTNDFLRMNSSATGAGGPSRAENGTSVGTTAPSPVGAPLPAENRTSSLGTSTTPAPAGTHLPSTTVDPFPGTPRPTSAAASSAPPRVNGSDQVLSAGLTLAAWLIMLLPSRCP